MKLDYLPSTRERVAILRSALFKDGPIRVGEVARESTASKGLVSAYLHILSKEGILERRGRKFIVKNTGRAKGLKLLLAMEDAGSIPFSRYKFVESAGLYGSCAKGENTESSDMDIWVKVKGASQNELALLNNRIKKRLPHANVLMLTKEKLDKLKAENRTFYNSLYFGSIIIYGKTGV